MTTRNLDALFEPRSIALFGASNQPGSVGALLARNLLESGFEGPVMAVNPHERAIRSTLSYRSAADLPFAPDLAVIATPAASAPAIVSELGARGCRAALVISAGFDAAPGGLRDQLLEAARPHLLRVVGPNCLGFLSPRRGINASFAHLSPAPGAVALVAQSGAVAAAALDWAAAHDVGFSHIVTIGDAADVDFGDLLDYLALDPATHAILLYVESIRDARKFMTAGRIASRVKPVVVIKAGRSAGGARAAFSHTGALAGADAVYDAAFRRAGMLRVEGLRELFDAVTILTAGLAAKGERLAILTNGGGAGVMAADTLEAQGGRLAELSGETRAQLAAVLPKQASTANPVDIIGDAPPERYRAALGALLSEPEADAVLVLNCPTAVADSTEAAEVVVEACAAAPAKPVFTCWLGDQAVLPGRRRLAAAGVPTHQTPEEAVRAFMHLVTHRRHQALLMSAPATVTLDAACTRGARATVEAALAEGRRRLTDPEARDLLRAYGIPTIDSRTAPSAEQAGLAAEELGGAVALKIVSRDLTHKSDVGGVVLNLAGRDAVTEAASAMQGRIAAARPEARLEGFLVEPMISRPLGEELIAGVLQDAVFGPVVLFGQGGVAVEVDHDRAVGLAPLDKPLARDLIESTRVARRLAGYRDRPPADMEAIAQVLVRLARLAADLPEVIELDINPLLADAGGVLALDARARLGEPVARPAICPYPEELVRPATVGGLDLILRPVRPQDAIAIQDLIARSEADDVRLRFGSSLHRLSDPVARRLSQIDYDREMALVAETPDGSILGVARLVGDPRGETAEFALMVRSDRRNRGLGRRLLADLLAYAAGRGLQEVWGEIGITNARMLGMADALGFRREPGADPGQVKVVKRFEPESLFGSGEITKTARRSRA
jgi:acetyltransferase